MATTVQLGSASYSIPNQEKETGWKSLTDWIVAANIEANNLKGRGFDATHPDYGATGDGATDDTSAISAALQAANGSGFLYLPKGTYIVDALALQASGVYRIIGAGPDLTVLKHKNSSTGSMVSQASAVSQLFISDLTIDGNQASVGDDAIALNVYVDKCRINNCKFVNTAQDGIRFANITDYAIISGCDFYDMSHTAVSATGETYAIRCLKTVSTDSTLAVTNCRFEMGVTGAAGNNAGAIYVNATTGTQRCLITGNHLVNMGQDDVSGNIAGAISCEANGDNSIIANNLIEGVAGYAGIWWKNSNDVTIEGNIIDGEVGGSGVGATSLNGIRIDGTASKARCIIRGNQILNLPSAEYGILASYASSNELQDLLIDGNIVANCDGAVYTSYVIGHIGVTHNKIKDMTGTPSATQKCVFFDNTATRVSILVDGNSFEDVTDSPVFTNEGASRPVFIKVVNNDFHNVGTSQTSAGMVDVQYVSSLVYGGNSFGTIGGSANTETDFSNNTATLYLDRGHAPVDGFYKDNLPAPLTAEVMARVGGTGTDAWYATRSGSVVGLYLRTNSPRTDGTATATLYKNNSPTGLTAVLNATDTAVATSTAQPDTYTFVAGDRIDIYIASDSSWKPTTADITAGFEVNI